MVNAVDSKPTDASLESSSLSSGTATGCAHCTPFCARYTSDTLIYIAMDKTVTIYSTPTCHFCHMTKDFLTEKGISFTDYNVASDIEKRQEMMQKSGQMGVPVIFVGDEMTVGFDKERLSQLLGV